MERCRAVHLRVVYEAVASSDTTDEKIGLRSEQRRPIVVELDAEHERFPLAVVTEERAVALALRVQRAEHGEILDPHGQQRRIALREGNEPRRGPGKVH